MLFSFQPAFLFIHVDKVAGSSIQRALRAFARPGTTSRLRKRLTWLGPLNRLGLYREMNFPEHATARDVQRCFPREVFAGMFKFGFVRNPWDRLVSRYAYLRMNTSHHRSGFVSRMSGFEAFVAWETAGRKGFQHPYLIDAHGRCLVDFIGRYELLHEDFAQVCARLGVQIELPHANSSPHEDYRTYYTPATRELVARYFQRDIELFGYDFDGPVSAGRLPHFAPRQAPAPVTA
jgi:Sulfotransferase family